MRLDGHSVLAARSGEYTDLFFTNTLRIPVLHKGGPSSTVFLCKIL